MVAIQESEEEAIKAAIAQTVTALRNLAAHLKELAAREPSWTMAIGGLQALANNLEKSLDDE